tara:strand:+ start:592 stop:786 length:195 start_codon:yes stop_codon:yes gene_type:complete
MVVAKIAQAVMKLIMPQLLEHFVKVFKLDKMLNYMELPNDADKRIDKLEEQMKMVAEEMGKKKL